MRPYPAICIVVAAFLLLGAAPAEAKRRKHKGSDHHHHDHEKSDPHKTKTKTKWSTSTDLAANSQVSTEEHGYYVKRTYAPSEEAQGRKRLSPPYLAIPIAWFSCESSDQKQCLTSNSAAINSAAQSLSEGYLCDDDCEDLYEPICGKTNSEVAVFYSQCKLNVAKCRSHGLWTELPYAECQAKYPTETAYADKKFRASPYFRDLALVEQQKLLEEQRRAEEEKEKLEKEQKKREKAEKKKKEKDSSESSEEKEDEKGDKPLKDELPTLPLLQNHKPVEAPSNVPVAVAVPTPIAAPVAVPAMVEKKHEPIALPPMPMKEVPSHKPIAIAMVEAIPPKVQAPPKAKEDDRLKYTVA
ncbi:uncharacterized protein ImpL1 [Drosophila bipectinata]|uniref:uncharacterized protein ImpL1 n=1 Tax=Drosophila bipectinata TaxID=42026 RepID=UPI001C8A5F5A|nr:uncharacterized protein LOC108127569 [Drosophila bipectinata]